MFINISSDNKMVIFMVLSMVYFGLWDMFFKNHLSEEKKAELRKGWEKGIFYYLMFHKEYMLKPSVFDYVGKRFFPVYLVTTIAWLGIFFLIVSETPAAR